MVDYVCWLIYWTIFLIVKLQVIYLSFVTLKGIEIYIFTKEISYKGKLNNLWETPRAKSQQ